MNLETIIMVKLVNQKNQEHLKERKLHEKNSLQGFINREAQRLKQLGHTRTSETYISTSNSLSNFLEGQDICINRITSQLIQQYEAYLTNKGLTRNSSSFYIRVLRAIVNKAIKQGITKQNNAFDSVYTGIDKTVKRAISIEIIKQIQHLDITSRKNLDYARDMFLFSLYTRGMSFIDMAYLKKTDLKNNILTYRRRKTKQQLIIKWEPCMQSIVQKYENKNSGKYILPILGKISGNEQQTYKNEIYKVNRSLKIIGKMVAIEAPLTMYVARHSWASIAYKKRIPLPIISQGMGHKTEATTRIYLDSLESSTINNANRIILQSLKI